MLNLIDSNTQSSVKVIAEVGVNHNGDIEIAKELINCARQSGADYVKFQTFKAEKLVTRDAALADYQKSNVGYYGSQFEMLKKFIMKCFKIIYFSLIVLNFTIGKYRE